MLAGVSGYLSLQLMLAIRDTGGDINGTYGKLALGLMLMAVLPFYACAFAIAAIAT